MKRIISLSLVFILLLLCFAGCKSEEAAASPLTVNGTPVDAEIFRYYLDEVWNDPLAGGSKDGRITEATHKCIRYVAVNSTFTAYSLSLSDSEKADISTEAAALWNLYEKHYESIGVGKEAFLKIRTSEAYIEKLRLFFFDRGGTDEISDAVLRGVLSEKYIAFRYVRTPLTDSDVYGNTVPLSDDAIASLNRLYNAGLASANATYNVDNAFITISKEFPLTEQSFETQVVKEDDHRFSSAFFNKVRDINEGRASVFQYDDYVYLVFRVNIVTDPVIFAEKRSECLIDISEEPLQSKINIMCNAYQSVRDPGLVSEYYSEVANNR